MSKPDHKGRGCLIWGCVVGVGLLMLFVVGLYFVGRSVSRAVTEFVDQYTESVPRSLPRISISETELTEIRDRFESFRTAMTERQEAPPLELSARDLNALIQHDRMFSDLKDRVFFEIEDNRLKGEVSIPLGIFEMGFGEGLYLYGSAVFDLSLDSRGLAARVIQMELSGRNLPEEFMKPVRNQNIVEDVELDGETKAFIDALQSIRIENNRLLFELKSEATEGNKLVGNAEINDASDFEQP